MRIRLINALIFLISFNVGAQILDDSTKQVYGPQTSFYFHQKDVEYGEIQKYNPDTTLNKVHRYSWLTKNDNFYQELGNYGTALYPVFYVPERSIGTTYGINIYDEYYKYPANLRYYDTRSPFTELSFVQGANNFVNLKGEFSRNINEQFNVTFGADRIISDKAIANIGRDRLVNHWVFHTSSNFRTKNNRYLILYSFSHMNHFVEEQGGIRPVQSDRIPEDLYLYQSANVWLNDAYTWERRNNHHVYQHFRIIPDTIGDFKVFHEFDRVNVKSEFSDENLADSDTFYNFTYFENPNISKYRFQFTQYENKMGISGKVSKSYSYKAYYKIRNFYSNLDNEWAEENFVGGEMIQNIRIGRDTFQARAAGELEILGDYKLDFSLKDKLIYARYLKIEYSPSIVNQRFKSNSFLWNNNFGSTRSDNFEGGLNFRIGKQFIRPEIHWSAIRNHIYYDENAMPTQNSNTVTLYGIGAKTRFEVWKLHFEGKYRWSISDGPDIFRFPEHFAQGMVYFETRITRGKAAIQFGFEAFYRSAYRGMAYMPAIFNYHLQNEFLMPEAIVPDVFVNFQFRKAQAFIKVPYFIQGWAVPGYFSSPYYTGIERPDAISLGFRWQFYD